MDVRPGGKWRYVSSAPDREDVEFFGEYLEIDPPKGFTWTFMFDVEGLGPQGGPETFTLEDLGGRTKVRSVGHMGSPEAIDGALASGMVGGAIETWTASRRCSRNFRTLPAPIASPRRSGRRLRTNPESRAPHVAGSPVFSSRRSKVWPVNRYRASRRL